MKFGIKLWSINKKLIKIARHNFLKKDFDYIREKLSVIRDLNINDKLGYDENDVLYIDKYQWGQYFRRVWYGQS